MAEKFNEVVSVFSDRIKEVLMKIPENIKHDTYEIRVRKNMPVVLAGSYGVAFVDCNSIISHMKYHDGISITENEFTAVVSSVCGYSVYSHQTDISNGFVTFGSGNRVGFCGTAVMDGDNVVSFNNLSSLNIRIARDFDDTAKAILSKLYKSNHPRGLIIAGAPCSGKTTVLKSMAKMLSSEYTYGFRKCTVIDERFEMCQVNGVNCDILCGYKKEIGIVHALRTLSPQIIICDEISTEGEAEKIIKGLDSGVSFIVSVHASDRKELMRRSVSATLINAGCFENIVILGCSDRPGEIKDILKTEELLNENVCSCIDTRKHFNNCIYSYPQRNQAYL